MDDFWNYVFDPTTATILAIVAYFCTWTLIPWVLLKRRVHESASVAWLIAIVFIPFVGAILCLLLGNMRWEKQSKIKREASAEIRRELEAKNHDLRRAHTSLERWTPLAKLVEQMTGVAVTDGNEIDHLPSTVRSLQVLEDMLRSAQDFIHIEFYIWRHDRAGHRIQQLLMEKAREGVTVRLLYDGFGSLFLGKKFLKAMEAAGVEIAQFAPGLRLWPIGTLHLRNHRKIVVVDGRVGFTGGMNIGDEYIHPTKDFGEWRDTQLRVGGPVVLQLQRVFAADWFYATGETLTSEKYYPAPNQSGQVPCQVVADGPDNEVDIYYCLLVAAFGMAQQSITIATPYFVPPDGLAVAMQAAVRRGVRVRIMVADRGNWLWTKMAGRSYYHDLLAAGIEILEYEKGLYHPKTITVDGEWSLIGTPNCDYRSLFLNFEVAIASFNADLAKEVEVQFEKDATMATPISFEAWQKRPKITRLHEEFWRLFAPVW